MSKLNEITDEEFVPFLHNLGVDTCKKSFEWLLNEPTLSGVFTWLYNNLDHNNALTAREEYRYTELQKNNWLLPPEDLNTTLSAIQQEYPGICLPGDQDSLEDVQLDISNQKEMLHALEREEKALIELVQQNKIISGQLAIEITKLNAAQQQYSDDEAAAASECLTLAEEVETLTEGVVDVIADALEMHGSCYSDKDTAKKFLTFGPLEAYRQSQTLFRSHFNLYLTRKLDKPQHETFTDDLRTAVVDARRLEDRLSDAALAYIESKADLSGEHAKLALVANYNHVHQSQIAALSLEAQSEVEILSQEEAIVEQEIQAAVKDLVSSRTKLAVNIATRAAVAVREQIHSDISHLLEVSGQALSVDRLVYWLLRVELRAMVEMAQFASQLRDHLYQEGSNVPARIESMSELISAQESATLKLSSSDVLLRTLKSILGCESDDVTLLVRMFDDFKNKVKELKEDVKEGYKRKEEESNAFKTSIHPLKRYIFDGCTRQPSRSSRAVTSLTHTLAQKLDAAESTAHHLGGEFTAVKNGDKNNMRKLWQWFLTDPTRLVAAVKGFQN